MFAITVTEKGGEQRRLDFDKQEVTIGRVQGNDVILPKGNVSKRHARIVLKDGKFIIVDLKSTNGTYVNGRKITSPLVVKDADKIYIGDFILGVEEPGAGASAAAPMSAPPQPGPPGPPPGGGGPMRAPAPTSGPPGPPPGAIGATAPLGSPPAPMGAGGSGPVGAPGRPPGPPPGRPPAPSPMAPSPMAPSGPVASPPPPRPTDPRPSQNPPPALADAPAMAPRPAPRPSGPPPAAPSAPPPASLSAPPAPAPSAPVAAPAPSPLAPVQPIGAKPRPLVTHKPVKVELSDEVQKRLAAQRSVLDRLIPRMELDDLPLHQLDDEELWQKAESTIVDLVDTMKSSDGLPDGVDKDQLIKESLNEALGLGALEDLLADDDVDEILVDRCDRVLVRRNGDLEGAETGFSSNETLLRVIERLVVPAGARVGASNPVVHVRLRDGASLTAAVPPVAVGGGCLRLRKPGRGGASFADLQSSQMLSSGMVSLLETCIAGRRNVLVCGPMSADKAELLSALGQGCPDGERIVAVSAVGSLAIDRDECVALEAAPGQDLGAVLHSALRMAPDRLILTDVTGGDAAAITSAMAGAVDGAIVGCGGSSAASGLDSLAAAVRLGAPAASHAAARELVAAAVDVVVCVARYADGTARVNEIAEVVGTAETGFRLQGLFEFRGGDGGFAASGAVPQFYGELEARGVGVDASIFRS